MVKFSELCLQIFNYFYFISDLNGDGDCFQCGKCKEIFTNLNLFLRHKAIPCLETDVSKGKLWLKLILMLLFNTLDILGNINNVPAVFDTTQAINIEIDGKKPTYPAIVRIKI